MRLELGPLALYPMLLSQLHDLCTTAKCSKAQQRGLSDSLISLSFFLAMLCSMKDLSSLTRDQTHAPCSESRSLNHYTTREVPPQLLDCDRRGRSPGR